MLAEHPALPGVHIGCRDEQLDRPGRQRVEIDQVCQDVAQRVPCHPTQRIGRDQPRHQIHGDEGGRVVQRPFARQDLQRPALERAEARGIGRPAPESGQHLTRGLPPAGGHADRKDCRVHGAGRGAGDAIDLEPVFLEDAVQNAPGKRPMRTAPLQGEVDGKGFSRLQFRVAGHFGAFQSIHCKKMAPETGRLGGIRRRAPLARAASTPSRQGPRRWR